jgi:hypothetical protein
MRARLVFNAIVQQYYIPGLQISSIVTPDKQGQKLESVFTVNRWVLPGSGCLWCSGAIDRHLLAIGAKTEAEQRDQDYGSGARSPSVITLNSLGASTAANDFLFSFLEMFSDDVVAAPRRMHRLDRRVQDELLIPDPRCPECGSSMSSRLGRGDSAPLSTVGGKEADFFALWLLGYEKRLDSQGICGWATQPGSATISKTNRS